MNRLLASLVLLAVCFDIVVSQQTGMARVNGKVADIAGGAIPKVQITIEDASNSFKVVSDESGKFQIDLPPGKYQMRSDKLPGFGATKREIAIATKQVADVTIVPAISEEGVLCILRVTSSATPKRRTRKRHR